ncbi:MAG: hypothetical protein AAF705_11605, partial [Bacteroidota bacterium]
KSPKDKTIGKAMQCIAQANEAEKPIKSKCQLKNRILINLYKDTPDVATLLQGKANFSSREIYLVSFTNLSTYLEAVRISQFEFVIALFRPLFVGKILIRTDSVFAASRSKFGTGQLT